MSFAAYYSLFEHGPDKYSIHPFSPRSEILRYLKERSDIDIIIIGGGVVAAALAHQCVLHQLSVVIIDASDYGGGRSQLPLWSSSKWFDSAYELPLCKVSGALSESPHSRFSSPVFLNEDAHIQEGVLHDAPQLVFDAMRAARSEGVFALNFLKAETVYRLADRTTVKIFDALAQERIELSAGVVINATHFRKIGPHQKEHLQEVFVTQEKFPLPCIELVDSEITLIPNRKGKVFCISKAPFGSNVELESIFKRFNLQPTGTTLSLPQWYAHEEHPLTFHAGIMTLPDGGEMPSIIDNALLLLQRAFEKPELARIERRFPSKSKIAMERQKVFEEDPSLDDEFLRSYIQAEQIFSLDGFIRRNPESSAALQAQVRDNLTRLID